MNLKQMDAALNSYRRNSDESDRVRLDFFRAVWAEQEAIASAVAQTLAYEVPHTRDLEAWFRAGEPVLSHAPTSIGAEQLGDAISRIAACLVEHGAFSVSVAEGFARTKWDRVAAASDCALAGSQPASCVEAFADLLADDGLGEDVARMGTLAAALALRALLDAPTAAIAAAHPYVDDSGFHPVNCPVCGGQAAVARVGGTDAVQGRGRELWCAQCGCAWAFERVRCARCGTQNQSQLHYFNVEGDDAHRLATCDECGGYVRTVYQEDALAPFAYEVEDVVMARLDAIAAEPAFAGGK